ncbi:hypothetical protein T265_15648, partial [Opisthorchis viverrini]
ALTEIKRNLEGAEEGTKAKLSELLRNALQQLKEEISTYLFKLINLFHKVEMILDKLLIGYCRASAGTITEKISSLEENQPQAQGVAALFFLEKLQQIKTYLDGQWPKLKAALEELNEKLKAAKDGTHTFLGKQLNATLFETKDKFEKYLEDLKKRAEKKLAELKTKLTINTLNPTDAPTTTGSSASKSNADASTSKDSSGSMSNDVIPSSSIEPQSLTNRPTATIWITSMLLIAWFCSICKDFAAGCSPILIH